jgi:hypothetical protein
VGFKSSLCLFSLFNLLGSFLPSTSKRQKNTNQPHQCRSGAALACCNSFLRLCCVRKAQCSSWNRKPSVHPPHPTPPPTPSTRTRRASSPMRRRNSETASSHPSACRRLGCATSASLRAATAPSACVNHRRLGRRRTLQGLRQLRRPRAHGARLRRASSPGVVARFGCLTVSCGTFWLFDCELCHVLVV